MRRLHKPEDPAKRAERLRQFRLDHPERNRAKNAAYRAANPEKQAAHKAVEVALVSERLRRRPCERCGAADLVHAHHDNYQNQLDVMWLCPSHHRERHRELRDAPASVGD